MVLEASGVSVERVASRHVRSVTRPIGTKGEFIMRKRSILVLCVSHGGGTTTRKRDLIKAVEGGPRGACAEERCVFKPGSDMFSPTALDVNFVDGWRCNN